MGLDTLEFRTPIAEYTRQNQTVAQLVVHEVWQRRLKNLWAFILGTRFTATMDFPSTDPAQASEITVAAPGAKLGDYADISPREAALVIPYSFYTAYVNAAGQITAVFFNGSTAAIDPPSGVFNIQVRPQ